MSFFEAHACFIPCPVMQSSALIIVRIIAVLWHCWAGNEERMSFKETHDSIFLQSISFLNCLHVDLINYILMNSCLLISALGIAS